MVIYGEVDKQKIKGGSMTLNPVVLAKGSVLEKHRYDVSYLGNGYKLVDEQWFIFGNETLFPVIDPFMIMTLNELNMEV